MLFPLGSGQAVDPKCNVEGRMTCIAVVAHTDVLHDSTRCHVLRLIDAQDFGELQVPEAVVEHCTRSFSRQPSSPVRGIEPPSDLHRRHDRGEPVRRRQRDVPDQVTLRAIFYRSRARARALHFDPIFQICLGLLDGQATTERVAPDLWLGKDLSERNENPRGSMGEDGAVRSISLLRSRPPQLLQTVIADTEVVSDLVDHRLLHLGYDFELL